ncbi:MAG: extracellular solute-binding protein [Hungatella sp.]|nr:extracellular solute-binding protein [Hungatella sp.]
MKKWNKAAAALLAGTMALSLAACGGGGTAETKAEGGSGDGGASAGGQTLKILLSEEPGEGDALTMMFNKWAEETGNKLDIQIIAYDDQLTKFPAMAKNKDLPDIISTTRLHQLYPEEFVDLRDSFDMNAFEASALKIVGKDYVSDKITGLPQQFTATCVFYNKDAFEAAGLEAPTADKPWTWDELYANAAVLMEKGGVKYGFAADVSRARYDILMYANGGSLTLADGDSFKVNVNCDANVKTLEAFAAANQSVMPQAIWSGATADNPADYFKNGDVGIYLSGSWNYASFVSDISAFKFGLMPSPKGSAGQSCIIGGSALAVPANAANSALGIEFLKWMYTDENFKTYIQADKGLSSLTSVIYEPDTDDGKADYAVIQGEVAFVTDTFMVDESSAWRNYKDNEYRDYLKRAVSGEMTAKEALDAFANELAESSSWAIAQ